MKKLNLQATQHLYIQVFNQFSRGLFTDTIGSRGCPAGYHFVYVATNSGGYYATRLRTCFRGTSYTPDGGSEGGNHD